MSDKTFGELFWGNVDKLLKENKKGLKDISRFLESEPKKSGKSVSQITSQSLRRHESEQYHGSRNL